jgi:hypothetical protein
MNPIDVATLVCDPVLEQDVVCKVGDDRELDGNMATTMSKINLEAIVDKRLDVNSSDSDAVVDDNEVV